MDEDAGSAAADRNPNADDAWDEDSDGLDPWDSKMVPVVGGDDSTDSDDGDDSDGPEGSVAGTFAPDLPIEPQVVDPRNVAFVAIGGYFGLLAIAALIVPQLQALTIAWLTVGFAAVTGLAYAFFARTNPDVRDVDPGDGPDADPDT